MSQSRVTQPRGDLVARIHIYSPFGQAGRMSRKSNQPGGEEPDLCCLVADKTAQAAYDRVARALGPLQDLLGGIAYATVGGTESRAELLQAADLLEQVAAILTKTSSREAPWYDLLERLAPRQILGQQ